MKHRREDFDGELAELADPGDVEPQRIGASERGMVATAHHEATEVGAQILSRGGNAVDAATAAAFALGVCEPAASGLGGQTMMLIHLAETRKTTALDGSSRAPNRATPELLRKAQRRRGHCATTVPSTPAVLAYAQSNYGQLDLSSILEPVIRLAEQGYKVSRLQHALTTRERKQLRAGSGGVFFLKDGKRPLPVGAVLRQPVLAKTLQRLASAGIEDFYQGSIAAAIHSDMETHGGLLHKDDLAQIPWPMERKPLSCRFDGHRILTFPPPGAGRALVEMLNILEEVPDKFLDLDTPKGAVILAEVIRQAYIDRRDRPFDPTYFHHVDDKTVLTSAYAQGIAKALMRDLRRRPRPPESPGETTHLSVMDSQGNVVALTQSIERVYGSFEASPTLGFLYNNYMSAFETGDIAHPYYLRPNAVPWASVAPSIVFRGRRPWLAIGSPGSERIAPSIVQVLLRLRTLAPFHAVAAPRLHCSLDGTVSLEASRMRSDIPQALRDRGFQISEREAYSFYLGCIQLVQREKDAFIGVADPRRDGSAKGPD